VTEMGPREAEIDSLLRRSMAAPIPSVPSDFDARVVRQAYRSSEPLHRYGRVLLSGYCLLSVAVSAVVMRGEGLNWGVIAGMTLAPLVLTAAGVAWRGACRNGRQGAGASSQGTCGS
jgi:hypothetical protein